MLERQADNPIRPLPAVRGHGHTAPAAVFGLAAVLMLSAAHLATLPTAGSLPMARGIAWVAAPPGTPIGTPRLHRSAARGAFWAGLISLASGVAIVQWAKRLRSVRITGRFGP